MSAPRTALLLAVLTVVVADATAQRGRFRRGRGGEAPAAPPPAPAEEKDVPVKEWLAIVGGDVHVGDGRVLRGATVLLGDDKVRKVGHDVEVPEGARTLDARGKVVTPGYVAVKAAGIGTPQSVTGELVDAVNPFDPRIKMALAVGITSYLHSSGNGQGTPGGNGTVVKLAFGDAKAMVRKTDVAYSMRTPLSASEWQRIRELIEKAKEFRDKQTNPQPAAATPGGGNRTAGRAGGGRPGGGEPQQGGRPGGGGGRGNEPPTGTKELVAILEGRARLWVRLSEQGANDTDAIAQAMELAHLLGQGVVLDDPTSAWLMADDIAATGSMVALNPRNDVAPDPYDPDRTGTNLATAAILAEAGVPVAVTCPSGRFGGAQIGTGGILGQDLNTPQVDAAYAVRGGLPERKALRTLTLDAAKLVGADAFLGSLEPGKDADVLILDGDPLSYKTFVETAVVNGKVVYEKDKESYYSHLKR